MWGTEDDAVGDDGSTTLAAAAAATATADSTAVAAASGMPIPSGVAGIMPVFMPPNPAMVAAAAVPE